MSKNNNTKIYRNFNIIKILDEGEDIQNELIKKTDQETVPNIFIKQQHIGKILFIIPTKRKEFFF